MSNEISFDNIDIDSVSIDGVEVVSMSDAMALPETGASSGGSSCGSCSTCGSSSCCGSSGAAEVAAE